MDDYFEEQQALVDAKERRGREGLAKALAFIEGSDARYFLYGDDGVPVAKQDAMADLLNMDALAFGDGVVTEFEARLSLDGGQSFIVASDLEKHEARIEAMGDEIGMAMDLETADEATRMVADSYGDDSLGFLAAYLKIAGEDLIVG